MYVYSYVWISICRYKHTSCIYHVQYTILLFIYIYLLCSPSFKCMYIYIYTYIHICIYTYIHIYIYTSMDVNIHVYLCVYKHCMHQLKVATTPKHPQSFALGVQRTAPTAHRGCLSSPHHLRVSFATIQQIHGLCIYYIYGMEYYGILWNVYI